jgi:hypothetical protein
LVTVQSGRLVQRGHLDVEQADVRAAGFDRVQRLPAVRDLRDDFDIFLKPDTDKLSGQPPHPNPQP